MKRLSLALLLGLMISLCGIGTAQAIITVDGMVSPSDEWDVWTIKGLDPNESLIDDDYDIKMFMGFWDNSDPYAYFRTDLFGIPTLAQQDPENETPVFYQWMFDTINADGIADLKVVLKKEYQDGGGNNQVLVTRLDTNTAIGYYPAHIGDGNAGSIVEWRFTKADMPDELEPDSSYDVAAWMKLDNAGEDPDDRLPDVTGWITTVPEPSSMLMLGMGLIGLVGKVARKKFRA